MPRPVEVTRLEQAIEQFKARSPQNLPDGVTQALDGLRESLSTIEPDAGDSPGRQAAQEVAAGGTNGTGEHYSKAARGADQPSPGQREAASVSGDIEKAAASIAEKIKKEQDGDREGTATSDS
jgi:hypothetical protein